MLTKKEVSGTTSRHLIKAQTYWTPCWQSWGWRSGSSTASPGPGWCRGCGWDSCSQSYCYFYSLETVFLSLSCLFTHFLLFLLFERVYLFISLSCILLTFKLWVLTHFLTLSFKIYFPFLSYPIHFLFFSFSSSSSPLKGQSHIKSCEIRPWVGGEMLYGNVAHFTLLVNVYSFPLRNGSVLLCGHGAERCIFLRIRSQFYYWVQGV